MTTRLTKHALPSGGPEEYEQACLQAVRRELRGIEDDVGYRHVPKRIHHVGLRDYYPETTLVVAVSRGEFHASLEWALWSDDFGETPEAAPPAGPQEVAVQVLVQVYEFGG